jgi:hypothetical protein
MGVVGIQDEEGGEDQGTFPALRRPSNPRVLGWRTERRSRAERKFEIRRKAGRTVQRTVPRMEGRNPPVVLRHLA